jgi:cytochrome c553
MIAAAATAAAAEVGGMREIKKKRVVCARCKENEGMGGFAMRVSNLKGTAIC